MPLDHPPSKPAAPSEPPASFGASALRLATERAQHATQLADRLDATVQAAQLGTWSIAVDTGETEWNEQMFALFEMAGVNGPPTLKRWLAEIVHPDDAAFVASSVHGYLRGERALETEFRICTASGKTRWMLARAALSPPSAGHMRAFGIVMDVTERHEALAAAQAEGERSRLIAGHAGIGIWEATAGVAPAVWDAQMFRLRGLDPDSPQLTVDQRITLVHPEDRDAVLASIRDQAGNTGPRAYEFRVSWPDGSVHWLASRSSMLRDAKTSALSRVGINWDITEARNAAAAREQALLAERASRAKSEFLSRMSHELRTPLNAVIGFAQLLQAEARHWPSNGPLVKLNHIRTAGEQLLTLINDALDLSGLETGTLTLDTQPVNLAAALQDALPLVEPMAFDRGVLVQHAEVNGDVVADPRRLRQVLLNLIGNAVRYNKPGGVVSIEAEDAGTHQLLRVRDTGRGMTADQLARLFEPFQSAAGESHAEGESGVAASAASTSSGIGLTVARAFVEGMGGTLAASSERGIGTVFEIALPNGSNAALGHSLASQAGPLDAASGGISKTGLPASERRGQLLYIEDNDVNVMLVEELVKTLSGLNIVSEVTGEAGVARAVLMQPDLILIDLHLPDIDGFEVLHRLRARPETARIRCIALSANAMTDDIERGLAAGFDDYWTKPIKFKPFLDALGALFPAAPRPSQSS